MADGKESRSNGDSGTSIKGDFLYFELYMDKSNK